MDMERVISLYMDECASKQLREKTMQSYEKTLKLFTVWLKENEKTDRVEDIEDRTIRRYVLDLQTRGKYTVCADKATKDINYPQRRRDYNKKVSNITINNYLRNLRAFFSWLVEIEYIQKSPMERIKTLPEQRIEKEYLEDDEVKELLKSLDKAYFPEYRDLVVMMIMLDSGTRLGETLSIEMNQIDLMNRSLHLPAEKTKGRKARTVFFSKRTEKELRRWIQFKDRYCETEIAFPVKCTGRELKISQYEANFRRYLQRIGIQKHITPHTLRNNFAKRCLLSGMDIYTLSRILGHSSVSVTEKAYLDIHDQDLKRRYAKFSPLENIYYQ